MWNVNKGKIIQNANSKKFYLEYLGREYTLPLRLLNFGDLCDIFAQHFRTVRVYLSVFPCVKHELEHTLCIIN